MIETKKAIEAPSTEAVAKQFSKVLTKWLGKRTMAKVVAANKEYAASERYKNCCASQDHCDANMAMDEAIRKAAPAYHKANYVDRDDWAADQSLCDLWNEAWAIAKKNGFFLNPTKL